MTQSSAETQADIIDRLRYHGGTGLFGRMNNEAADEIARLRAALAGIPDADASGWLIEKDDPPVYCVLSDDYDEHWTSNTIKALRFARREDAQAYSDHIGWTSPPIRVAEHMWPVLATTKSAPAVRHSLPSGESDPTVMPDYAGADTGAETKSQSSDGSGQPKAPDVSPVPPGPSDSPSAPVALREELAAAMMRCGLATGHGDTVESLIGEMEWQVERLQSRAALQHEVGK